MDEPAGAHRPAGVQRLFQRVQHEGSMRRATDPPADNAPGEDVNLNFKGSTGKTSLSVAFAYRLAELGHRVLLIDLDSQRANRRCLRPARASCPAG